MKQKRRRKGDVSGFIVSVLLSMFWHPFFGVVGVLLFVLRIWFPIPIVFPLVSLGIWIVIALVKIGLLEVVSNAPSTPSRQQNKNPYSAKNEDLLPNEKRRG